MNAGGMPIGRAAEAAGVTTRTLRYYEQLGLIEPAFRSEKGTRRYSVDDLARVERIRRLQDVLGHDLHQIAVVLRAEDRLGQLRDQWRADDDVEHRREMLAEAVTINDTLRRELAVRRAAIDEFADELETKARLYRRHARDLGMITSDTGPAGGPRPALRRAT